MIIQHNIMALNAHRQLTGNTSLVSKNIEKLSSGFKINRAGDDASGLAISEKMRAQIKGLEVAQQNAQDGISLIQTAEGALTEVHSMLNRMIELAEKSANGTIQNEVDREAIQKEVDDLLSEIDRISKATNFNGINLLGGNTKVAATITPAGSPISATFASASYNVNLGVIAAAIDGTDDSLAIGSTNVALSASMDAAAVETAIRNALSADWNVAYDAGTSTLSLTAKTAGSTTTPGDLVFDSDTDGAGVEITSSVAFNNGSDATTSANDVYTFDLTGRSFAEGSTFKIAGKTFTVGASQTISNFATATIGSAVAGYTATASGNSIVFTAGPGAAALSDAEFDSAGSANPEFSLTLQIGDSNDGFQKVDVQIDDLSSVGLGINSLKVDTQEAAGAAIADIKAAINKVSTNRANLGGLQNRLEHTINNLAVTEENMTAAESRIRDVDMAKEMMAFTKNNVLTQAAQAMLAQANTQPQSVLQLLQ